MLTQNASQHQLTRVTQSLSSLWSSLWSLGRSLVLPCVHPVLLLLLNLISGGHFANALSVDGNLASTVSRNANHHHYPEWNVDDWWRQTINEDLRKKFPGQLERLYLFQLGVQSQSFDPQSRADDWHHHQLVDNDSAKSDPLISLKSIELTADESTESAVISPSKRRRPTKMHFPLFPRDLDTSESLAMKTSNRDPKNLLFPKWKGHMNQSKTDATQNRHRGTSQKATTYIPHASLHSIRNLFNEFFNTVRNSAQESQFLEIKRRLRRQFVDLGLTTGIQSFNATKSRQRHATRGHNLIGIWPGAFRNMSGKDSILVIGAHYDTVSTSIGIEDNGSGSVAVLELARLLQEYKCSFNTTIMFVLFDMEEDGLYGSKHFVRDYLYPKEIERNSSKMLGAIIIDMLLEYDTDRDSQNTNDLGPLIPSWREAVRQNENRADFAAVWARRTSIDTPLYKALKRNWLNQPKYKLLQMDVPLPQTGRQLTKELRSQKLNPYKTFLRSDHSSFWYPHALKDQSLAAILLTDLGPWRRRVAHRYHSSADNTKLLTKQNLLFLKNSIDSLMKTLLELGGGKCQPPVANSVEAATAA